MNDEYKVKGHDESYEVTKQGSSLNATVKPSSKHLMARAIPEEKLEQFLKGSRIFGDLFV